MQAIGLCAHCKHRMVYKKTHKVKNKDKQCKQLTVTVKTDKAGGQVYSSLLQYRQLFKNACKL